MEMRAYTFFLAKNLRHLRQCLGLSQEEMAQHVGLNRGNVASYEAGTAEPKICNLIRMAEFFGVSITDLTRADLSSAALPASNGHPTVNGHTHDDIAPDGHSTPNGHVLNGASLNGVASNGLPAHPPTLDDYALKAAQISGLLQSIHTCFCFKVDQMEEQPKDIQHLMANYEQLFEASQHLLHQHLELLAQLRRTPQPTTP